MSGVTEGKMAAAKAGTEGATTKSIWASPSSPKPTTLRDDKSFRSAPAWHSLTAKKNCG
jgi:hypothetical protein